MDTYQIADIQDIYFLGIGGIGMSALARYFKAIGYRVSGYDRTPSPLTRALEEEGIKVQYDDTIPDGLSIDRTLVVRTPAVPDNEPIFVWMRKQGFTILKRAEVLGIVTRQKKALCVAGTHGKTTTSTILAHLMHQSHVGTNAFLGGISNNTRSNLIINTQSEYVVVEADEYDRSFHHLTPYMSIITAIDPDHLDIYGTAEAYQEGFNHYAGLVQQAILVKHGYTLSAVHCPVYTYSGARDGNENEQPDFYAEHVRIEDGDIHFDFHGLAPADEPCKPHVIKDLRLGVPVWVNIENSVAAIAMACMNGVTDDEIRRGIASFQGVYRRFNIHLNTPRIAYIDDYAHHPTELAASIASIRKIYPTRYCIGVFQPHLYTRTRDFAADFKRVLSTLDELILLPIYPAREEPIAGVGSELIGETIVEKDYVVDYLTRRVEAVSRPVAILSLGAGDIDRLTVPIKDALKNIK